VRPLEEQTVLVTGSTDGLGEAVARELAARGASVLVHGRDPAKVERVAGEIGAERGLVADFARLDDVRRLAGDIDRLDALVNNAGVLLSERADSAEGHELTLAVNHLAHFLLSTLLLPKLREPGRIVNVSSAGQQPLDFDDLMFERGWEGYPAYARSKLAQALFTYELAERLGDRDVTVNALHPATLMDTNLVTGFGVAPRSTVAEGRDATVRLVADPDLDGVSGRFFDGLQEAQPHPQAADGEARRRLWEESERLTLAQ
jgi:NAD(P)-dependent dehydrogenase (short-subunit alcohol dehydrogenase family)